MPEKENPLVLGAHISIEGGLEKSLIKGNSIGCTVIQIFTKSNRQWTQKQLSKEEIKAFLEQKSKTKIQVIAHASYLINLASDNSMTLKKSTTALIKELERCEALEIPFLVLHPGSRLSLSEEDSLSQVASAINDIFKNHPGKTMVLLETMAGQGTSIGKTFEQIGWLLRNISDKKRIGVCIDTCHLFAAGYSFSTKKEYESLWSLFDQKIGINHIKAIHLNDSKKELGSCVDRHEDIGIGKIGIEGFRLIMNDTHFSKIPKILETPKESLEDDARNMKTLKELLK